MRINNKIIPAVFFLTMVAYSQNQCYAVTVGDSYGGGTVFCVSKTSDTTQCVTEGSGDYGLIMANEDQVNFYSNPKRGVTWARADTKVPGAQSEDNGAVNTAAIIAAFPEGNPDNNAAWACHDYIDQIELHTDWYLPSKNELNKMHLYAKVNKLIGEDCLGSKANGVQCLVGSDDRYARYWSSSEYSDSCSYAWHVFFSYGGQGSLDKISHHLGVRAIRAF